MLSSDAAMKLIVVGYPDSVGQRLERAPVPGRSGAIVTSLAGHAIDTARRPARIGSTVPRPTNKKMGGTIPTRRTGR